MVEPSNNRRSQKYGKAVFEPAEVYRSLEEAVANAPENFDYVLVSSKSLPIMEEYDFALIFESVITLAHTCIVYDSTRSYDVVK
ncbi:hypothetical protein FPQ18DRAFT_384908 [Pyronema domesticum]|nr:hypothetical protein FPQ18DRAFT_384908 [Pyronema domesticum]